MMILLESILGVGIVQDSFEPLVCRNTNQKKNKPKKKKDFVRHVM